MEPSPCAEDNQLAFHSTSDKKRRAGTQQDSYGYVIVLVAFLSNLVVDGIDFSFGSLKDSIYEYSKGEGQQEINQATLALMGSLLTGFSLLTGPVVSALARKVGFRAVAVLGSLITTVAFILLWHLSKPSLSANLLIILYGVIGGIGFCFMYVPAQIAVAFYFEENRSLAMGIAVSGSGVGTCIFPPLITFLAEKYQWHGAVLRLSLIVFACGVLSLLYKPLQQPNIQKTDTLPVRKEKVDFKSEIPIVVECEHTNASTAATKQNDDTKDTSSHEKTQQEKGLRSIQDKPLFLSLSFILFASSCFFTTLGMMVPFVYLINQAESTLYEPRQIFDRKSLSLLISSMGAANIVGRILSGWLANLPSIKTVSLNTVVVTIMAVSTVSVPYLNQYHHFLVYSCVFGACIASFISLKSIVIVELLGLARLNEAFGLILFFQGIASMASTPLAATLVGLAGKDGDFSVAFFAAGGFFLLAAVLCYPLKNFKVAHI